MGDRTIGLSEAPDRPVQLYDTDEFLAEIVASFVRSGLAVGQRCFLIATAPHLAAFAERLRAGGVEVSADSAVGDVRLLDAEALLGEILVGSMPDPGRFQAAVGVQALVAESQERKALNGLLRGSIRELGSLEETLRQRERELQTIIDALPVLISYVDRDCRYRLINRAYEAWFGQSREAILGRHVREVLGGEAFDRLRHRVEAALAGETQTFELRAPYLHGGERFVEASYVPTRGPDGQVQGYIALVADISERKRSELAREAAAQQTERLMRITAAIADAVTADEVFQALVDEVSAVLGASSSGLWIVSPDGREARLARSHGYAEPARRQIQSLALGMQPSVPALDAIRSREPIWIGSQVELLEKYPHLAQMVTKGRNYQIASLPLVIQGKVVGTLAFTFDDAPPLDADHKRMLLLVARHSGQALERLRLLEAEQESRRRAELAAERLGVLSSASRALSEAGPDLSRVLQALVEHATEKLAHSCVVALVPERGDVLEIAAALHRNPQDTAELRAIAEAGRPRRGEGITGQVAATGEAVFLPALDPEAMLAQTPERFRDYLRRNLPRTLIAVPLRARGRILGVLTAARQAPAPAFEPADLRLFEELAERAALAIDNSVLQKRKEQARRRAEILYGLAHEVITAQRVEQVFEPALDAIERGLGTDRAAILALDPDDAMRFKAWRRLSEEYRRAVEGHSPWPLDARAPEPILVSKVDAAPQMAPYLPLFRREEIAALAFIPLVAGDRLIGKFMVYFREAREMSPDELELARALADHVAAALARFGAIAELERSVRFNELFTGVLGHDLRNPLAAIMTSAQLAMMQDEGGRLVRPVSRILRSGDRMARMIGQLLDFTRMRLGGGIPLSAASISVVPLMRQVMEELEDANPDWTLQLEHAGDGTGTWDGDRLSQVFSNLIANAGQHGKAEHPVRVRIDGTEPDHVRIEIHNWGEIPATLLPGLFEPLAGQARRREGSGGLGLGLHISRELAKAHGGSIAVTSDETRGTTFTVTLPREAPTGAGRTETDPEVDTRWAPRRSR